MPRIGAQGVAREFGFVQQQHRQRPLPGDTASNNAEAALANNPALSDAAALGLPYAVRLCVCRRLQRGRRRRLRRVGSLGGRRDGRTDAAEQCHGLQTQTATAAYNGSTIRSAVGDDTGPASAAVYTAGSYGTGLAASAGWRNFTTNKQLWTTTPTSGTGWANTRTTELLGGKLFGSMSSGSTVGIYVIDPSGSNPAFGATSCINVGTSSNHSPYEFALFDDAQIRTRRTATTWPTLPTTLTPAPAGH